MKIQGIQRVSLLDFPERIACTVFTCGCNFRCPFCHNASLAVPQEEKSGQMEEEAFFTFLASRRNKLDGVCISGGEPLLQEDIASFIVRIRDMGFAVKLDTNGSMPERLKELLDADLLDYVAMDIKNSPEKYARTTGMSNPPVDKIRESVNLLISGTVPYEFRTTLVKEFHAADDIAKIGRWIQGAKQYYLQEFVDSGNLIGENLHACTREEQEFFCRTAAEYVPSVQLRGV